MKKRVNQRFILTLLAFLILLTLCMSFIAKSVEASPGSDALTTANAMSQGNPTEIAARNAAIAAANNIIAQEQAARSAAAATNQQSVIESLSGGVIGRFASTLLNFVMDTDKIKALEAQAAVEYQAPIFGEYIKMTPKQAATVYVVTWFLFFFLMLDMTSLFGLKWYTKWGIVIGFSIIFSQVGVIQKVGFWIFILVAGLGTIGLGVAIIAMIVTYVLFHLGFGFAVKAVMASRIARNAEMGEMKAKEALEGLGEIYKGFKKAGG